MSLTRATEWGVAIRVHGDEWPGRYFADVDNFETEQEASAWIEEQPAETTEWVRVAGGGFVRGTAIVSMAPFKRPR